MEPKWLIGEPDSPEKVNVPQQAVQKPPESLPEAPAVPELPEVPTGRYKGRTAAQWRDMAATAQATGKVEEMIKAREYRLNAQLAINDGIWEFPALFTLTGALVPDATWVKTRKGKWVWRIGRGPLPQWFDPSKALNGSRRRRNDAEKGFAVGVIRARGQVCSIITGTSVGYYIGKVDNSPIEIVDDGRLGTQYQDR